MTAATLPKVGELFTRTDIETRPCVHCGAPAVVVDHPQKYMHFETLDNGAMTAQFECTTTDSHGRRKLTGTMAEVEA